LPLAFIGGLHKGKNLNRFFRRDRCDARLEELGDLEAERIVAAPFVDVTIAGG